MSEVRERFAGLEEITTYYPLKLSSSGARDIAGYSRDHAKQFKSTSPVVQGSTLLLFYQVQVTTLQAAAKLVILRESKNHEDIAIIHFLSRPSYIST